MSFITFNLIKLLEENFTYKRSGCYLLLLALLFLIQPSLSMQSQRKEEMLQGPPDPLPLHPTHMTYYATTSGWAEDLQHLLPLTPVLNPGRNRRETQLVQCRWTVFRLSRWLAVAFT